MSQWNRAIVWRMIFIGLGVLILCSCRGPATSNRADGLPSGGGSVGIPAEAYTGVPTAPQRPCGPPGMELGVPLPYCPTGPWQPPGIGGKWPGDEYVCDGGNAGPPIRVGRDKQVRGLEMEDTIAHFDTLDGRTLVESSNQVCLYAPRFGAVRQVVNAGEDEQRDRAAGVSERVRPAGPRTSEPALANTKNLQAGNERRARPAEGLKSRQSNAVVVAELGPRMFDNVYRVFENVGVIRTGVFVGTEAAFLAKGVNAAVAWTHNEAAQVILDHNAAVAEVGTEKLQMTYAVAAAPGHPRLRIIKVASTPFAEPGDDVSFTLRFDNVGDQPIGNVTILDSLSTRLEFVPGSAQCSLKAKFSTQPNEGESVVVRCELSDPLPPGKGGVLRFRCVVR